MNAILNNSRQVEYYTNLNPIFMSIQNRQHDYNWLLTDLEMNWIPDDFLSYCEQCYIRADIEDRNNRYFISGEKLTRLTMEYEIQFIWGVLTGLKKELHIDLSSITNCPDAENPSLWKPGVNVQYPGAELEIVCWDSTSTLLISQNSSIVNDFKLYFSDAQDLDEHISQVQYPKRNGRD